MYGLVSALISIATRCKVRRHFSQRIFWLSITLSLISTPSYSQSPANNWKAFLEMHEAYEHGGFNAQCFDIVLKAREFASTQYGARSSEMAIALAMQGACYREISQYDQALPFYQQAFQLTEELFGPMNSATATSLTQLADIYSRQGKPERALPLNQRALSIDDTVNGHDHVATGRSLNNLADVYNDLEQYEKALPLVRRALLINEKILGHMHPDTATSLSILAVTSIKLSGNEAAISLSLEALKIREKTLGIDHPRTALDLKNLAHYYDRDKNYSVALSFLQRALKIQEATFGNDHVYTVQTLDELIEVHRRLGQVKEAIPLVQSAINTSREINSNSKKRTATLLNRLGILYSQTGQYNAALPILQEALNIREINHESDPNDVIQTIENLSSIYIQLGQYKNSLPLSQRAFQIAEKKYGPEAIKTGETLLQLAVNYGELAHYEKALDISKRALSIYEKTYGSENPKIAPALTNFASLLDLVGQHEEATPFHAKSMSIVEKYYGSESPNVADAATELAYNYTRLSRHREALALRLKVLAIRESVSGKDHPQTASALNDLSATYSYLSEYENALPLQIRALEIRENKLDLNHQKISQSLSNIGTTYFSLGQFETAVKFQERALAIDEKYLENTHPETAILLTTLAQSLQATGQNERALTMRMRALDINTRFLGENHPRTAESLNSIGISYFAKSDFELALGIFEKSLTIREKIFGTDHEVTAENLINLAVTHEALKHHEKVLPMLHRAYVILLNSLGATHPRTADAAHMIASAFASFETLDFSISLFKVAVNTYQVQRERVSKIGILELQGYTTTIATTYQRLALLLTYQGRLSEAQYVLDMLKEDEQFEFIRRSKDADPRRSQIGYTHTEQKWMERFTQISSHLATLGAEQQALNKKAKLGLTDTEQARQKQLQADLKVAQTAFTAYLDEMRTGFAKKGSARVVEVEESSEQSLKLMQATLQAMDPGAVLVRYYMTDTQVKMLVTTPGVQLARDATIAPKELNSKIAAFNAALRDPKSNPLPLAQELYTALVGPIAQDLQQAGATTVMLYLDGALRYLPFSALHDGKQYLVERWRMPIYTAVAKDKLREAATPQWTAAGMGVTRPWREFAALPAVKQELSAIVKNTSLLSWGAGGVLPGELFVDEQFTAKSLRDVGQRPFSVLHIASHFRFSPGTEVNSALLLGDGQELTLGDIRTQGYSFKNVDLLTLSACETGLGGGRDERGREIEGFGVIAQQQGAKAVLATLWPVADQSTALLMQELYRQRQEKHLTKAEALRQAQLTLMGQKKYSHPFYWAPFILMGNWL